MLYKSGENLFQGAKNFISEYDEITVFSAYLKTKWLEKLNEKKNIKQVVVRWEIKDLCLKVSDLDLYSYCLENGISLFRNTRLHLKSFWNGDESLFMGSANLTGRGIGEKGAYNYELNCNLSSITPEDILYLNNVIEQSEYISEDLFNEIKSLVESTKLPVIEYPELETKKKKIDHFLISQLPMSNGISELYSMYANINKLKSIEKKCLLHDLSLYNIPLGLDEAEFYKRLRLNFNNQPFIVEFKKAIKAASDRRRGRSGSMRFGAVRKWFSDNTTTVPTPRPFELNENVRVLYDWICYFDDDYYWNRPSHTQVIHFSPRSI